MSEHDRIVADLDAARRAARAALLAGDAAGEARARRAIDTHRKEMTRLGDIARLLAPDVPLACLPVRIETAFRQDELCVRVYPDTIHLDDFDPRLSRTEASVAADVAQALAEEPARRATLHRWMDDLLGAARARHVRTLWAAGGANIRVDDAEPLPARADLLPDRWTLELRWDGGALSMPFPALVADPLPMGPSVLDRAGLFDDGALRRLWDANGPGPAPGGMSWMVDFEAGLAAGMACIVDLTAGDGAALGQHLQTGGALDSVTVHGFRWTGAETAADDLRSLLRRHSMVRKARIGVQGSATSNDGDARTPGAPERLGGPNLDRISAALGLGDGALDLAGDTDHDEDRLAGAMIAALWPGTVETWLRGALGLAANRIPDLRDFARDRLRGRGPLSVLQIGAEPYGILPVTIDGPGPHGTPEPRSDMDVAVAEIVSRVLHSATPRPVDGRAPRNHEDWLDRMGRIAHPGIVRGHPWAGVVGLRNSTAEGALLALGLDPDRAPVLNAVWGGATIPVVPPLPMSGHGARRDAWNSDRRERELLADGLSLRHLVNLLGQRRFPMRPYREMPSIWDLARGRSGWGIAGEPRPGDPLLYSMLRHALFTHLTEVMRHGVRQTGEDAIPFFDRDDGIQVDVALKQFTDVTGIEAEALTLPLDGSIAARLQIPNDLAVRDKVFGAAMNVLREVANTPNGTAVLDTAFREALGLASYRVDPWLTALDAGHLAHLRAARPRGIGIAGFGRVLHLRPDGDAGRAGEALTARGVDGAITTAILRDAARRRRATGGPAGAFALDLSSKRVRAAIEVLESLRAGRSLGEVLGQRAERVVRAIHGDDARDLHVALGELRDIAPLREERRAKGDAARRVDIADGAKILELAEAGDLPGHFAPVVDALNEVVDAIADLELAEAVHGTVSTGPERAGAAVDALSRAATPPDRFDAIATRRGGQGLTVRLVLLGGARPRTGPGPAPDSAAFAAALSVALGPVADAIETVIGPSDRLGAWTGDGAGRPHVWRPLSQAGLDAAGLVFGAQSGRSPRHPGLEALMPGTGIVSLDRPGPDGQPPLSDTLRVLSRMRRALEQARGLTDEDLPGADLTRGDGVIAADLTERIAHLAALAQHALDRLDTATDEVARADALRDLACMGRPGAAAALMSAPVSPDAARIEAEALRADLDRAADTDLHVEERLRALAVPDLPVVPLLDGQARSRLAGLRAGDDPTHSDLDRRSWADTVAKVRAPMRRAVDALEGAELLRDETLYDLTPLQSARGPWAAMAAPGDGFDGIAAAALGPLPAEAAGGVILDEWAEVIPDAMAEAALAVEAPSPRARAPQSILLALPSGDWPEDAPLRALDRTMELLALRAMDPDDTGAIPGGLPPILSFLEMPE